MSDPKPVPPALRERVEAVRNKRARFVLDTILAKGSCSTLDLKAAGYDHPPRAARAAVELGFALKTIKVKRADGQNIAAYQFDERELDPHMTGRVVMPKKDRDAFIESKGGCCHACGAPTNLQIDHRIPYAVAGESQQDIEDAYQVLDGSCNRCKSWACEHCKNLMKKDFQTCLECYWASPTNYTHVAMRRERRIDIVWTEDDFESFQELAASAARNGNSVADEIKARIKQK